MKTFENLFLTRKFQFKAIKGQEDSLATQRHTIFHGDLGNTIRDRVNAYVKIEELIKIIIVILRTRLLAWYNQTIY